MELEKSLMRWITESTVYPLWLTCTLSRVEALKELEEVDRASLMGPWRKVWNTWDGKTSWELIEEPTEEIIGTPSVAGSRGREEWIGLRHN